MDGSPWLPTRVACLERQRVRLGRRYLLTWLQATLARWAQAPQCPGADHRKATHSSGSKEAGCLIVWAHDVKKPSTLPQTNMEAPRTPLEDLVPFTEAFWELPC